MIEALTLMVALAAGGSCPAAAPLHLPEDGLHIVAPEQLLSWSEDGGRIKAEKLIEAPACQAFTGGHQDEALAGQRVWLKLNPEKLNGNQSWGIRIPATGYREFCIHWPVAESDWNRQCMRAVADTQPTDPTRILNAPPNMASVAPPDLDADRAILISARSPFRASIPLLVGPADALVSGNNRQMLFNGAAYGALATLVIYGLLLLGSIRQSGLLYFSVYIGAFGTALFVGENLHQQWFGLNAMELNLRGPYFLLALSFLAGSFFLARFLRDRDAPAWRDRLLWLGATFSIALMMLAGIRLDWALWSSDTAALLFASVGLVVTAEGVFNRRRNAGPLLLGFVFLLLALCINGLVRLELLPPVGLGSFDLLKLGILAGGLSLGLAVQREFATLRKQRDRASLLADTHQRIARYRADFDTTTGLPGRRRFFRLVTERVAHAQGRGVGLLMIRLEGFRRLRHFRGQEASDDLLRIVVGRLQALETGGRVLARTETDEFSLLLPLPALHNAAESLVDALAAELSEMLREPIELGGEDIALEMSIGGSLYPGAANSGNTLLRQAEAALFEARATAERSFSLYGRTDGPGLVERWEMRNRLVQALADDALDIHYQTIIDLDSGQIRQLEVLARWHDPVLGDVPPSLFIGVAESFGLIDDLGRQVIEKACRQLAAWERKGRFRGVQLALNLSPLQLRDPEFEPWLVRLLRRLELSPHRLNLEVTENVLVENLAAARVQLGRLARRGIGISVDDFGVGYSSLSYIRELPIDVIKIDRSFVARLDQSAPEREILRSILDMAAKLQLDVVAEGIEREGQAAFLRENHCPMGQGFLFSRPAPATAMEGDEPGPGAVVYTGHAPN